MARNKIRSKSIWKCNKYCIFTLKKGNPNYWSIFVMQEACYIGKKYESEWALVWLPTVPLYVRSLDKWVARMFVRFSPPVYFILLFFFVGVWFIKIHQVDNLVKERDQRWWRHTLLDLHFLSWMYTHLDTWVTSHSCSTLSTLKSWNPLVDVCF